MTINRRILLGAMAALPASAGSATPLASLEAQDLSPAARAPSPRDQAVWHLRELERLMLATGAGAVSVMAVGIHYPGRTRSGKLIGINHDGSLMDFDGVLDGRGPAS